MGKTYRVSRGGRWRAGVLLVTLAVIFLYSARKALGLWMGDSASPSNLIVFGLNLNTFVPALLLTLVAVACVPVGWYLVVELLTKVEVSDSGLGISAPGYRVFYRWEEVSGMDVLDGPSEDAPAKVLVAFAAPSEPAVPTVGTVSTSPEVAGEEDELAPYLSEADRREDKAARHKAKLARLEDLKTLRARATQPDGRQLTWWLRLLYPQARKPDRLLLYPALEGRPALLADIAQHLGR